MRTWADVLALLVVAIGVMVGAFLVIGYHVADVQAASSPVDPIATCELWGVAGKWTIERCEDDDGYVCFHSDSGMLDCKLE